MQNADTVIKRFFVCGIIFCFSISGFIGYISFLFFGSSVNETVFIIGITMMLAGVIVSIMISLLLKKITYLAGYFVLIVGIIGIVMILFGALYQMQALPNEMFFNTLFLSDNVLKIDHIIPNHTL